MILLTRPVGNSGRIVSVFSSSAIGEAQASILERCLERINDFRVSNGREIGAIATFWRAGQEYPCITRVLQSY